MNISAKAPCRVDIAGGTLDIWPLYLFHPKAVTVNFAIDRYAACVLKTRKDRRITIRSLDLNRAEEFDSLDALRMAKRYKLPLAAQFIEYFAPSTGLDLITNSEVPAGAGLGGSSTLTVALSAALNRLTRRGYDRETLREIAHNIEARVIRSPTGCQDYVAATFGGVSAIELTEAGSIRKPVAVDLDELNERIVLAYTGEPRNSGINNWQVVKAHLDGDRAVQRSFDHIAAIAREARSALERSGWRDLARLIREEWANRKKNVPGIATPFIERLIAVTRRAGASAAKVCGAGGGGCVFFWVERGTKQRVSDLIGREGARVLPVRVARKGVNVSVSPR
ncbi:MAG: hypothetical protein U0Q18_13445 [Bryobacteraceae bacterium]